MSRIGQKPITVPDKVKVAVQGPVVNIEGPRGKLRHTLPDAIIARLEGKTLLVENKGGTRQHKALHGLSRSLLANFVQGANEGFQKKLEIQGVGFKAALQGKTLVLNLGFSHPINYPVPDDIKITVTIEIPGHRFKSVGDFADEMLDPFSTDTLVSHIFVPRDLM